MALHWHPWEMGAIWKSAKVDLSIAPPFGTAQGSWDAWHWPPPSLSGCFRVLQGRRWWQIFQSKMCTPLLRPRCRELAVLRALALLPIDLEAASALFTPC